MFDWTSIIVAVVFTFFGFFLGYGFRGINEKYIGTIVIENDNQELEHDVYSVFNTKPENLKDGQVVTMDILNARDVRNRNKTKEDNGIKKKGDI